MDLANYINCYRGPLIGLLASWGVPWSDAVEIAQDSFADAWLNRNSCRADWRDQEVFGRWLRGVARNKYRTWARNRGRQRARLVTLTPTLLEHVAAGPDPEPSQHIEALRQAIERLPAKQRQAVLMHYLEESSIREISGLLSVTVKTVEGRLYQARKTLRRLLDDRSSTSQMGELKLCL